MEYLMVMSLNNMLCRQFNMYVYIYLMFMNELNLLGSSGTKENRAAI